MENQTPNPADIPAPGSYHWTPALQRSFLEHLADSGSVKIAAMHVKMTSSAAYQLRQRAEGAAFRIGWGAAILIARQRLADELLDRAIWGYQESSTIMREDDRSFVRRQRVDSRLGLAMLARLDRMVETRARAGEEMLAQIVAGDWAGFLTLFDAAEAARTAAKDATGEAASEAASEETPESGMGAALALWLAGRDNRTNPIAALWRGSAIANEVAQFSGTFDTGFDGEPEAEPTPEEEAEAMTVWHHHETGELRTNFPPPMPASSASRKAGSATRITNAPSNPRRRKPSRPPSPRPAPPCARPAKPPAAPSSDSPPPRTTARVKKRRISRTKAQRHKGKPTRAVRRHDHSGKGRTASGGKRFARAPRFPLRAFVPSCEKNQNRPRRQHARPMEKAIMSFKPERPVGIGMGSGRCRSSPARGGGPAKLVEGHRRLALTERWCATATLPERKNLPVRRHANLPCPSTTLRVVPLPLGGGSARPLPISPSASPRLPLRVFA